MSEERRTIHQRIAELLERHEQSRAELADLKARAKEQDRKFETRRKIILGAAVQAHAKLNGAFREELRKAVLAAVTRPHDRAVLPEFFPDRPTANAPPARLVKVPEEPASGAAGATAARPRQDGAVPPESFLESPPPPPLPTSASPTRPPKKAEPPPSCPPSGAAPA